MDDEEGNTTSDEQSTQDATPGASPTGPVAVDALAEAPDAVAAALYVTCHWGTGRTWQLLTQVFVLQRIVGPARVF